MDFGLKIVKQTTEIEDMQFVKVNHSNHSKLFVPYTSDKANSV